MANLTADRNINWSHETASGIITGDAKNATTFYRGGFVMLDISTGYIEKAADTANFVWQGIVARHCVGDTTATPNDVEIVTGPLILNSYAVTGTSAVTHQGDLVYATDDQTLTVSATANTKAVGYVLKWLTGTSCDVYIFSPEASRAQN